MVDKAVCRQLAAALISDAGNASNANTIATLSQLLPPIAKRVAVRDAVLDALDEQDLAGP